MYRSIFSTRCISAKELDAEFVHQFHDSLVRATARHILTTLGWRTPNDEALLATTCHSLKALPSVCVSAGNTFGYILSLDPSLAKQVHARIRACFAIKVCLSTRSLCMSFV
jgi:hypothetical protein